MDSDGSSRREFTAFYFKIMRELSLDEWHWTVVSQAFFQTHCEVFQLIKVLPGKLEQWLNGLSCLPLNAKIVGSSPNRVTTMIPHMTLVA
jgi:hypothetical protein